MTEYLEVCEQAARAGGDALRQWQGRFTVRHKGPSDPVTEADLASQEAVQAVLAKYYPTHDFLSEEEPHDRIADGRLRWILDPLDGTQNYVHGLPIFAVSLALERDGSLLTGCIYNPAYDECFTAAVGKGAFYNGQRIETSGTDVLHEALVAVSLPPRISPDGPELANVMKIAVAAQGIRRFGSSALNLCWVASGKLDAFFATDTKVWDVAAGMLLVQEARGSITNFEGGLVNLRAPRVIAAATGRLGEQIREKLAA